MPYDISSMNLPGHALKNFALLAIFFLLSAARGEESSTTAKADEVMFGVVFTPEVNGRSLESQIQDMKDLGVNTAKFWLDWNWIEPRLAGDFRLEDLKAHPELIDEYAFPEKPGSRFRGLLDYSKTDRLARDFNAAGISPLPLIADAIATPLAHGEKVERISPEPEGSFCSTTIAGQVNQYRGIGRERYLAHIYLHAAGLARRYSRPPMQVDWWNTENELNWTYIHTTIAGWRCGKTWTDQEFLTDLLRALHDGIKAGNPQAATTMNVNIHDPDWISDLARWAPEMDALGLGSYPNYIFAWPLMDRLLTQAVSRAVARSRGKPVFVLETGYPSGPKELGWNDNLQAHYISKSVAGTIKNGGRAYIYFKLDDTDLAIPLGSLQKVENHWGLVRLDGTRKPGFFAYQKAIANYNSSVVHGGKDE